MSFSLTGAVRTATVDTGYADNMQSTRTFNMSDLVCPPRSGFDETGRPVNPNTYVDVTAGCSNPMYRVNIENALRPRYTEYVTLSASGIQGKPPAYLADPVMTAPQQQSIARNRVLDTAVRSGPSFGNQFRSNIRNTAESVSVLKARDAAMAKINQSRPASSQLVNARGGLYKVYGDTRPAPQSIVNVGGARAYANRSL